MTKRALTRMCGAPRESKKLRWIFRTPRTNRRNLGGYFALPVLIEELRWIFSTPRTNRRNLGGYFALPVLGGPGGVSLIKQVRELLIRGDSSSTPGENDHSRYVVVVRELQIGGDSSNIPGKNDHSPMPKFIKQVRELLIRGNSSSMPCKLITHLHRIRATVDHPVRGSLRTP
jgi:hypothetical protein